MLTIGPLGSYCLKLWHKRSDRPTNVPNSKCQSHLFVPKTDRSLIDALQLPHPKAASVVVSDESLGLNTELLAFGRQRTGKHVRNTPSSRTQFENIFLRDGVLGGFGHLPQLLRLPTDRARSAAPAQPAVHLVPTVSLYKLHIVTSKSGIATLEPFLGMQGDPS